MPLVKRTSFVGAFFGIALAWPGVGEAIAIPYALGLAIFAVFDLVKS